MLLNSCAPSMAGRVPGIFPSDPTRGAGQRWEPGKEMATTQRRQLRRDPMAYEPKNYDHLKGGPERAQRQPTGAALHALQGLRAKLNEIEGKLAVVDQSKPNYSSMNQRTQSAGRLSPSTAPFSMSSISRTWVPTRPSAPSSRSPGRPGGKDKLLAEFEAARCAARAGRCSPSTVGTASSTPTRGRASSGPAHRAGPAPGAGQLGACLHGGLRHQAPRLHQCLLENIKWAEVSKRFGELK